MEQIDWKTMLSFHCTSQITSRRNRSSSVIPHTNAAKQHKKTQREKRAIMNTAQEVDQQSTSHLHDPPRRRHRPSLQMQTLANASLLAIASFHNVSAFGNIIVRVDHRHRPPCSPLHAEMPPTSPTQPSSNDNPRTKKKNKYSNFSKADGLTLDPFDAIIKESRTKLMELHREDTKSKRRKKSSSIEQTSLSLEAIDRLLSSLDIDMQEKQISIEEEKRERNKRVFPDTQTIDPYDPTTYGYIELGKCVSVLAFLGQPPFLKYDSLLTFANNYDT